MSGMKNITSQMTYEEALEKAKSLAKVIRERGKYTEELRKIPKETIDDIVKSGLVRLLQPARWGGHELPLEALVDTTIEISKADPSSGWCYTLLGLHSYMLAGWPEQAQQEVWSQNQDALIASAFAPIGKVTQVNGGYRLSGKWSFSSGVDHCQWAMVGAFMPPSKDGEFPKHLMLLIPKEDYEIEDDWFVAGIKGSGSKTIVVEDAFVPEHRVVDLVAWSKLCDAPGMKVNKGQIYQLPLLTVIGFFLASSTLGAAKGAYELWKEAARNKVAAYTLTKVTQFTHQQIRLARIAVELDSADLLLHHAVKILQSGQKIDTPVKVRLARDFAYVAEISGRAVQELFKNSGATSIYENNPIQRYWRDTQIMSMHAALNFDFAGENYGRVELGVPLDPKNIYF